MQAPRTVVVTAGAEARCAQRFTGDSCGRSVDREAVAADVMDSWNGEVTLPFALGLPFALC